MSIDRPLHRVACPAAAEACGWRGYRKHPNRRACPACGIAADKIEVLWQVGLGAPGQPMKGYLVHWDFPPEMVLDHDHLRLPGGQVIYWPWRHYLGKARDVPRRYWAHRRGEGARVVAWSVQLGAHLRLARVWDDPDYEVRHKYRGDRPSPQSRSGKRRGVNEGQAQHCPICKEERLDIKLTPTRRKALEVLAANPVRARRTSYATGGIDVFWKTADWLVAQGWAEAYAAGQLLALTPAGAQVCAEVGIVVAPGSARLAAELEVLAGDA